MSHYHGVRHIKAGFTLDETPAPKTDLTRGRCIVCGASIENAHYYETKVHTACWTDLVMFNQILGDLKSDEELARDAEWLDTFTDASEPDDHVHVVGLGVDFDVTAMGENTRIRSDELKARIDKRMEAARLRAHPAKV